MIAVSTDKLTAVERSQLEARELAVGLWEKGDIEGASALLDAVIAEGMTPRVAVKCYVSQAAFRSGLSDYAGSLESLEKATPFLDAAELRTRGAFYNQRARIHRRSGNIDAALTDYTGAAECWESIGHPDYGAVLLNLAELYLILNDLTSARSSLDNAMAIFVETDSLYLPQAYDTLAKLHLAEGRIEQALDAIQKALDGVGKNEHWRQAFISTRDAIDAKLFDLLGVRSVEEMKVAMVRRALIQTNGNLTQAGKLIGLTHKGVAYVVDRHREELEPVRSERRVAPKKSVIKRS